MNADQTLDSMMELQEKERQQAVERAQRAAGDMPAGSAGECDLCGIEKPRLVNGICARCRDKDPRARHG